LQPQPSRISGQNPAFCFLNWLYPYVMIKRGFRTDAGFEKAIGFGSLLRYGIQGAQFMPLAT